MRILIGADVPADPNSGASGTVWATNQALRALGHQVDEIWADDLPHRVRHWNLHYLLELPRGYRNAVLDRCWKRPYDVIQLSQPHAWLAAKDHAGRRCGGVFVNRSHGLESMADAALVDWHATLQIPATRFPRSLISPTLRRMLHRHIDLTVRYADGMIVPAAEIRDHLVTRHGADKERVAVIYHGVPDAYLRRERPKLSAERVKRLLHVGQRSFIKGPHLLVNALEKAFDSDRDLRFTWVCDERHHMEALALFRPEFQNRVQMLPWRDQDELLFVYDHHGIFVAHSIYEGAAKACTEAMARGLVVVSSAVGALKDHAARQPDALSLVRVGDTDAMASEIVRLSNDLGSASEMGKAAMECASRLPWENCARESIQFYERLMRS